LAYYNAIFQNFGNAQNLKLQLVSFGHEFNRFGVVGPRCSMLQVAYLHLLLNSAFMKCKTLKVFLRDT